METARREFDENMLSANYALCVRGAGNFSFRLYEAMAMNRIPVIVDSDILLPMADFARWASVAVICHAESLDELPHRIAEHHASGKTPDTRAFWKAWLSPEGFFGNLWRYLP